MKGVRSLVITVGGREDQLMCLGESDQIIGHHSEVGRISSGRVRSDHWQSQWGREDQLLHLGEAGRETFVKVSPLNFIFSFCWYV